MNDIAEGYPAHDEPAPPLLPPLSLTRVLPRCCRLNARALPSAPAATQLQAVVDLITECISLDPLRRPTAGQALQRLQAADADVGTS